MSYATQATVERVVGPDQLRQLLQTAADPVADAATQATQRAARLQAAIEAGDNLIARYLTISNQPAAGSRAYQLFEEIATRRAIHFLHLYTPAGPPDHFKVELENDEKTMTALRDHSQWPAEDGVQSNQAVGYVESTSDYRRGNMGGFT